jgi:hypothetical protein
MLAEALVAVVPALARVFPSFVLFLGLPLTVDSLEAKKWLKE